MIGKINHRIGLLLFLVTPFTVIGQATRDQDTAYRVNARQLVDQHLAKGEFVGLAAGFSINGKIAWEYGAGYADQTSNEPFTARTLTRIASITKPMTAIAIMQLVEQGKVELDSTIQTYLPEFPVKSEGTITVRQLLQHSAGISGYKNSKERENQIHYPDLIAAMAIFQDRDLIATPGQAFNYTSYGYVVLGAIIEQVSGLGYEQYLQQHIWDKVGMPNTGVEKAGRIGPDHARLYHISDKGKISSSVFTDLSDRVPGGGVYSNLTDMLKFGDAVLNETLIDPLTLGKMIADPGLKKGGNGYGLGWYLFGENPKYGNVFGHNGSQTGASTFLMLLPEQGTTVVVLSNTSGALQTITNITIALFDVAASVKFGQ